ncbi:hypothetical protein RA271_27810, partial [Pseudomonas syringae pv. tagetis]
VFGFFFVLFFCFLLAVAFFFWARGLGLCVFGGWCVFGVCLGLCGGWGCGRCFGVCCCFVVVGWWGLVGFFVLVFGLVGGGWVVWGFWVLVCCWFVFGVLWWCGVGVGGLGLWG